MLFVWFLRCDTICYRKDVVEMVDEKVQLLVLCLDSIGQLVEDQKMTCSVLSFSPRNRVSPSYAYLSKTIVDKMVRYELCNRIDASFSTAAKEETSACVPTCYCSCFWLIHRCSQNQTGHRLVGTTERQVSCRSLPWLSTSNKVPRRCTDFHATLPRNECF